MNEFRKQICREFTIMEKEGEKGNYLNKADILGKNREERLVLFILGSTRVEYCKENFQYFEVIEWDGDPDENYKKIEKASNQLSRGLTVITGVVKASARAEILTELQGEYTKSIIIALTAPLKGVEGKKFAKETEAYIIEEAYLQAQLKTKLLYAGVDEVAFLYN